MHPNFICPYIYILKIKIINEFRKFHALKIIQKKEDKTK